MEKRRHARRDHFARVKIEYVAVNDQTMTLSGLIEDKSQSGFGIRIGSALQVGSQVTLVQANAKNIGIVRRCLRERTGYFVGIEVVTQEVAPAADENTLGTTDAGVAS